MDKNYESLGTNIKWIKKLVFSGIFIQENKLHAVYDRYNELSCKQWLLLAVSQAFEENPDLSKLANAMGCSRQNVKKLAIKLEKEGLVRLEKSNVDKRSLLLIKTKKGIDLCKKNESIGDNVHKVFFKDFSESEIITYYNLSKKIMNGIDYLDDYFREIHNEK